MKNLILILCAVFYAFSAKADLLNKKFVGVYAADSDEVSKKLFAIRIQENKFGVKDMKNNINYVFDLTEKGEQEFPSKYYDLLKKKSAIGVLVSMLNKITISDLVVKNSGKTLEGILNIHIDYKSLFSPVTSHIQFGFIADTINNCDLMSNGDRKKVDCIKIAGNIARIAALKTNFDEKTESIIGLCCLVRATPAQIGSEFKSTAVLKAIFPVPSAFFSTLELAV